MQDLHAQIDARLRRAVAAALGQDHADADPLLRPTADPRHGDYQANIAMSLAKTVGERPREVAERIVEHIDRDDLFSDINIAGPGFINLTLDNDAIADALGSMARDDTLGVRPLTGADRHHAVIDYSGPNVAKEMHVGHLRSTVLGDALARVLQYLGHEVTRRNHLGDWGTQFGMLIEHLIEESRENAADQSTIGDLNALYQRSKQRFDSDADFADRARSRVVKLQSGDEHTLEIWRGLVDESMRHFEAVYGQLGVDLTREDTVGESAYNDRLPAVVSELETLGLLQESEGARVVFPEAYSDREGNPLPLIVQKGDGGYLYATTDLAAALQRIRDLGADWLIYVTDSRQRQHFAMVFSSLRAAGWAPEEGDGEVRLDHVPFGTILGPNGRPFKTREGDTVKLSALLDQAVARADAAVREKNPDLPDAERAEVARVVGIGALKYADLSNDRVKDYEFNWDRMLALQGNTAPYLQYSYARIRSIFRKAEGEQPRGSEVSIEQAAERALALKLLGFSAAVSSVAESLEPHRLCTYLYELASAFHSFYEACPVLAADTAEQRASRMAVSDLASRVLRTGLGLLGIEVVERM